jgi:hypothetical protein
MLEDAALGMLHGKTFLDRIPSIGGATPRGFVLTGLIVSLVLVPYLAFKGIGRELGECQLRAILFHART